MRNIIFDLTIILFIMTMGALAFYLMWGPVPPALSHSPNVQELRAEINRLKPYEEFMNNQSITVVYNGCEDIRKRLGLTAGVELTP